MRSFLRPLVLGTGVAALLAACGSDNTTSPPGGNGGTCTGSSFSLASLEGRVIPVADLACLTIPADGGTYVVVPQFPTATSSVSPVSFKLTAGTAVSGRIVASESRQIARGVPVVADLGRTQREFDGFLRGQEHAIAASARGGVQRAAPRADRIGANGGPSSTTTFHVLANLSGNSYKLDTANLRYNGTHILIYTSKNVPGPADGVHGFSDAQIAAFGNTFDLDLYTIDVSTFGAPTDIDGNGKVIVLLSPIINSLTTANTCTTAGYIAGFFNAVDLLPTSFPNSSNGAEIFYALAPDPGATFSCAHSIATVGQLTPSTFIHEFQHMISFGQHAIIRDGNEEDAWLNEGLSHTAEELGSRYYEHKFPAPTGRTDPQQVFPDSSQGFISGDLFNSYSFLEDPTGVLVTSDSSSVSNWGNGDGTLPQRGGIWLFLRWLGDQQDSTVYGRLDQTSLTGVPNLNSASSSTFATLFGDFALALYTDSLPGVARSSIPSQFRYMSRNLRELYAKESARNPGTFGDAFPIHATALAAGSSVSSSMLPGTMDFYILTAPASGSAASLSFTTTTGTALSTTLNPQVSVFHCPSASACPTTP